MGDPIAGVWKSLALICCTVLVAGAPGIIYAVRTWGIRDDVTLIRDRQDDVRIRLTVLERQQQDMAEEIKELRAQLAAHLGFGPPGTR